MSSLLLVVSSSLFLTRFAPLVEGHGYMKSPRSRNFVAYEDGKWSGGTVNDPKPEDCPHCLNLGGTLSTCGLTSSNNYSNPLNVFGDPMPVNVQASYAKGQDIDIDVVLTAHHKGHFTYKACPVTPGEYPTQECFDSHPLEFVMDHLYDAPRHDAFPDRAYIPPSDFPSLKYDSTSVYGSKYSHRFSLPANVSGNLVILQWHYVTANSCTHVGYDGYDWPVGFKDNTTLPPCGDLPEDGNGVPEQFWNCAELTIIDDAAPPSTPAPARPVTAAPIAAVTPAPVPVPVATPSPVGTPENTKYCGETWMDAKDKCNLGTPCPDGNSTVCAYAEHCFAGIVCRDLASPAPSQRFAAPTQAPVETTAPTQSPVGTSNPSPGTSAPTHASTVTVTAVPTVPPTETTPTTNSPTHTGPASKTIIGYYASWQWYDRSGLAKPTNMDFTKVDRVNFAFFQVDTDGNIWGTDSWADPQVLFGPQNWNPKPEDPLWCNWDSPTVKSCNAHHSEQGLIGLVHAAGGEIYPSLGGWSLSDAFPAMAASPVARTNFANKCVELIQDHDFDGIDLDWEYPGYVDHSGTPEDTVNFNLLLDELRSKLDDLTEVMGKYYGITAALPCGPSVIENIDIPHVVTVLDELNLMTYDFHGSWNNYTGINAPMEYQGFGPAEYSVHDCVANWVEGGGSRANINIGLPFYGRSFAGASGLNEAHSGADLGNWEVDEGVPQYFNIVSKLGSMTSIRDDRTKTQYAYFNNGDGLVSYDDEQAICDKTEYVIDEDLHGFIIWELSGDLMPDLSTPLLDAVNAKLDNPNLVCGTSVPPTVPTPSTPSPTPSTATVSPTLEVTPEPSSRSVSSPTRPPATNPPTKETTSAPTTSPVPPANAPTQAPSSGDLVVSTARRCGASEIDAREHCRPVCESQTDCFEGQLCFNVHENYCGSITKNKWVNPVESTVLHRCGKSEVEARELCGAPCSSAADCAGGEICFGVYSNYCGSDTEGAANRMLRGSET